MTRASARSWGWMRGLVGIRRRVAVDGVRFRERGAESLERAMREGRSKAFVVTFADGSRMRINASRQRPYADLDGFGGLGVLHAAEAWLTPGMRVVVLNSSTGFAGPWLSRRVGPFGAGVLLEEDGEAAEFARRRYREPNVAYERGGIADLDGEPDGAFGAAIVTRGLTRDGAAEVIARLWRLVEPGGFVLASAPIPDRGGSPEQELTPAELLDRVRSGVGENGTVELLPTPSAGPAAAVARRPRGA